MGAIETIFKAGDTQTFKQACKGLSLINDVLPNQSILDSIYEGDHTEFLKIVLILGVNWSAFDTKQVSIAGACETFLMKYMDSGYLYKEHLAQEIVALYYSTITPPDRVDWFLTTHVFKHFDSEMVSYLTSAVDSAKDKLAPITVTKLHQTISKQELFSKCEVIDEI